MNPNELDITGTLAEKKTSNVDRRITQVIPEFRVADKNTIPFSLVICTDGSIWCLGKGMSWSRVDDIPQQERTTTDA